MTTTDYSVQRQNMVDSQLRPSGITSRRILDSMGAIPRELFVAAPGLPLAYAEVPVAAGSGRVLTEPAALARLVQLAAIEPGDSVLHVGASSGYGTVLLASLARSVVAVEEDAGLAALAAARLRQLGIANATVQQGPHAAGAPAGAPFDVIFIEGRIERVPETLAAQLRDGGRLVAVLGERDVARATLATRRGGAMSARGVFDISAAPLPGIHVEKTAFVF